MLNFENIPCNVCRSSNLDVLRRAETLPSDTQKVLEIYRSSSDNKLLDQLVKCRDCGLVFVSPRLDSKLILQGYAEAEDPLFASQNAERIFTFEKQMRRLQKDIDLPKDAKILDIGCAGGAFLSACRNLGFTHAQGIEPSQWMVAYCQKQGLNVQAGILQEGTFPPRMFDVVCLWDVLEHVADPVATLKVVASILKPGGHLVVNFPDYGSLVRKLMGYKWPFFLSVHLYYFTKKDIGALFQQVGLSVEKTSMFWQTLKLGYVSQRAAAIFPFLSVFTKTINALGLGNFPLTYYLGQSYVLGKRRESTTGAH